MAFSVKALWIPLVVVCSLICSCNSAGCLHRWFEFCDPITGAREDTCSCVWNNEPGSLDPVEIIDCRQLNMDANCCSTILDRLLGFYQLTLPDSAAECKDSLSNLESAALEETEVPVSGLEYIVPAFVFSCSGCIEAVMLVVEPIGNTGETQPLAGETVKIHSYSRYESTTTPGEYIYKQKDEFTISVDRDDTSLESHSDNYTLVTVPVNRSEGVCFQRGEVFGFSQPEGSNLNIIFNSNTSDGGMAYRIQQQTAPTCNDLQGFYELSATSKAGSPQIAVEIAPELTTSTVTSEILPTPTFSQRLQTTGLPYTPIVTTLEVSSPFKTPTVSPPLRLSETPTVSLPLRLSETPTVSSLTESSLLATPTKGSAPVMSSSPSMTTIIIIVASAGGAAAIVMLLLIVTLLVIFAVKKSDQRMRKSRKYEVTAPGTLFSDMRYYIHDVDRFAESPTPKHTEAESAVDVPEGEPQELAYDFPTELEQHPRPENMNNSEQDNQDIVESAEYKHLTAHSGNMPALNGRENWHMKGQGLRQGNDNATRKIPGGYGVPRELGHHKLSSTLPRMTVPNKKAPDPHVYHILENPLESLPRRRGNESLSEAVGGVHRYYSLDRGGSLPSKTKPSSRQKDGSLGRKTSKLAIATSIQRTPSQHQVIDCGIYVPNMEERRRLTDTRSVEEGTATNPYETWNKVKRTESTRRRGFFEDAKSFWKPSSEAAELYDQLAAKKFREILRDQIEIIDHLGSGQFGSVNKGLWKFPAYPQPQEVAVKIMKASTEETTKVRFLQEAAIMGQFFHPNVVKLHGVVTVGDPAMIVLELMVNGALNSYLRKNAQ